jgi:glycerate dehydrogenase
MKIVVLDGATLNPGDNPWDEVAALGELTVYARTPGEEIIERGRDAEVVLTNKTPLSGETLGLLPRLRFVSVLATGYNVVDVAAAGRLGIPVSNVPEYGSDSVAQHVLALLLELTNHVALHDAAVKRGEWSSSPDFCFWKKPLAELAGRTLGIIGMGRIGARVARIAHALGMRVAAHNPRSRPEIEGVPVAWLGLEELFREADVVSLHCPLTPENTGFVDRRLLSLLRPGAILINTARGPLVNEADLAAALNERHLGGAGLDVAAVEPIPAESPLLSARNCVITPHVAWASLEARRRLMRTTAENVAAFLSGKTVNVVNGVS